jgi:hypothetical protein
MQVRRINADTSWSVCHMLKPDYAHCSSNLRKSARNTSEKLKDWQKETRLHCNNTWEKKFTPVTCKNSVPTPQKAPRLPITKKNLLMLARKIIVTHSENLMKLKKRCRKNAVSFMSRNVIYISCNNYGDIFCGATAQRGPGSPYSRGFEITHNYTP